MARAFPILVVLLALGLTAGAAGQRSPRFEAVNRTVAVYATVTGADGRLVPDLTAQDFTVADNGAAQALTLFSNDLQPITIVLLLDRSGSLTPHFDLEVQAAEAFVRAMLPADRARIGSFGRHIQIDPEDFTSDRERLLKILHMDLQSDGPTPLWNAVDRGIDKLASEPGRRVILVFTDGVDKPLDFTKKGASLKDVTRRAEQMGVMVYAVGLAGQNGMPDIVPGAGGGDPRRRGLFGPGAAGGPGGFGPPGIGIGGVGGPGGLGGPGRRQAALEGPDEGLGKIAAATGGGYFELTSPRDLAATFARVADELHRQYALGFTPGRLDGKWHDLTVSVGGPGRTVRARRRYLARP